MPLALSKAEHYSRNTYTLQGQLTFANFWVDDTRVDSLHAFLSLQAEETYGYAVSQVHPL